MARRDHFAPTAGARSRSSGLPFTRYPAPPRPARPPRQDAEPSEGHFPAPPEPPYQDREGWQRLAGSVVFIGLSERWGGSASVALMPDVSFLLYNLGRSAPGRWHPGCWAASWFRRCLLVLCALAAPSRFPPPVETLAIGNPCKRFNGHEDEGVWGRLAGDELPAFEQGLSGVGRFDLPDGAAQMRERLTGSCAGPRKANIRCGDLKRLMPDQLRARGALTVLESLWPRPQEPSVTMVDSAMERGQCGWNHRRAAEACGAGARGSGQPRVQPCRCGGQEDGSLENNACPLTYSRSLPAGPSAGGPRPVAGWPLPGRVASPATASGRPGVWRPMPIAGRNRLLWTMALDKPCAAAAWGLPPNLLDLQAACQSRWHRFQRQ